MPCGLSSDNAQGVAIAISFTARNSMKILFLHDWQSTPGGVKPTCLKDHGHEVLNPALPDDDDFDAAVRIAQAEFDRHRPDVVVGSSRGGAVAMNMKIDVPLVLMCPAWNRAPARRDPQPGATFPAVLGLPAVCYNGGLPITITRELGR